MEIKNVAATVFPVFKIIVFLFALLVVLISPKTIEASQEFSTDFSTVYTIGRDGVSTVRQEIILTNKLPDVYATEYELEIGSNRIRSITASTDAGTPIPHEITTSDAQTTIRLNFNDKIVGRGKKRVFIIEYQNLDVSQKIGNVLEVTIPKLTKNDTINTYKVVIRVPVEFGEPTNITPVSYSLEKDPAFTTINFDSQSIKDQGITAIYGQKQIFDLVLRYHLENPTITPIVTQIALPPDTAYQRMYYESIVPRPQSIDADEDGNWIATFELEPKQQLTVIATVNAVTYLSPQVPIPTPTNLSAYLTEQKYWRIHDSTIKSLSTELNTPEKIYNYLIKTFNYNYGRLENQDTQRLGAVSAIKNPENVLCQEFTDAFVALSRAAGIPARAVTGFAYTENAQLRPVSLTQDVLHAWPEYYDETKKVFIPVDPTWGNTTGGIDYFNSLDFNHLVFAIQGIKSDSPLPVGYYKLKNEPSKDVEVNFGTNLPLEAIDLSIEPEFSSGLSVGGSNLNLIVTNNSNVALYHPPITISAFGVTLNSETEPQIAQILPSTKKSLPVKFTHLSGNTNEPRITITAYEEQHTVAIPKPALGGNSRVITIGIAITALVAVLGWFTARSRGLLVSKRQ